jgi:hypothetical protein
MTLTEARRNLAAAEASVRPLDSDTASRVLARVGADAFAAMQAEVDAIAATLPELRAQVAELEANACPRCSGSGDYTGPTRYRRAGGRPVCFTCNGSGTRTR